MEEDRLVNLTPHDIHILNQDGDVLMVLPSMGVARGITVKHTVEIIRGISIYRFHPIELIDLPIPTPGVRYIVSRITAHTALYLGRSTRDLLIPAHIVREDGEVVGCKALAAVGV